MSASLRGVMTKSLPLFRWNMTQKATVISGPPKHAIPMAEKVIIGSLMSVCTIGPAAWILVHLQDYKKRD